MTIHNIFVSSCTGKVLSGGEKYAQQLIPLLAKKYNTINYFGVNSLVANKLPYKKTFKVYVLFDRSIVLSNKYFNLKVFILYFIIFIKSLKWIHKFRGKKNVIISYSDTWPDTLFAFLLKLFNEESFWIALNHLIAPNPLKGYTYAYTEKYKAPSLSDIYQWLNRRLFFILQKRANLLIGVNPNDAEYLSKMNKNILISGYGKEYCGGPEFNLKNKIYDICFLGRFYEQKGINDIPDILDNFKKIYRKNIVFILIGERNKKSYILEEKLKKIGIYAKFLEAKYGKEKFALLKKTKILIFPSYYESFGIVYLDAISVGTPVVEYDLPCFTKHKYGAVKVPFKNNKLFAVNIKKLLTDKEYYNKISHEGYTYSKYFKWESVADKFSSVFANYLNPEKNN